ncbi:MAG: 16S rRNA (guanine(966)-N(2))-methyltransferase RsmD [Clostridiales bacterium]|nr:16S rRNA (guanine(966)-N(2))-methyltransferase RsmD [Clostridiales bacterium]
MRIISGEARGRTLFAPNGQDTRPTSDKIRGSLFNILNGCIEDAEVLDLFGGTGALALEALSRGAARAVISDSSRAAVECIRRNAENVLKDSLKERALILKTDYRSAITNVAGRRFDLVFLDPPYRMLETYADAISRLERQGSLSSDAIIIAERRHDALVEYPEEFEIYDTRVYGETAIDFLRRRQ